MLDGLIKQNQRRLAEQRTGEIEPLRLAERQHVLFDPGVEAARCLDAAVEFDSCKRLPALRIGGIGREEILADRIGKNRGVMQTQV